MPAPPPPKLLNRIVLLRLTSKSVMLEVHLGPELVEDALSLVR